MTGSASSRSQTAWTKATVVHVVCLSPPARPTRESARRAAQAMHAEQPQAMHAEECARGVQANRGRLRLCTRSIVMPARRREHTAEVFVSSYAR
jgi:hypothetical protein